MLVKYKFLGFLVVIFILVSSCSLNESSDKSCDKSSWLITAGQEEGKPVSIRIMDSAPLGISVGDYPNLIIIRWNYTTDDESGMPASSLFQEMVEIENALTDEVEKSGIVFLTATFLGNGVREWQFYARDSVEMQKSLNKTLAMYRKLPLTISGEFDPSWNSYFDLRKEIITENEYEIEYVKMQKNISDI